jgi:ABC-type phosphate transport system permease subunit
MVGPSAPDAAAPGALDGTERPRPRAPRALGALAALALGLAVVSGDAALALRLAAGSLALAALALALALPWALCCLVYLGWHAPPWLARGARPSLRLLASLPPVGVGLGVALIWRDLATATPGPLALAALALGVLTVPALVVRGDRLLAGMAPLREAALAVGARPLAAFWLVVWPAARPHAARALLEAAVKLTGEAASVVVIARALGASAPTLASALAERPAARGPLALTLALALALGALATLPARAPERG